MVNMLDFFLNQLVKLNFNHGDGANLWKTICSFGWATIKSQLFCCKNQDIGIRGGPGHITKLIAQLLLIQTNNINNVFRVLSIVYIYMSPFGGLFFLGIFSRFFWGFFPVFWWKEGARKEGRKEGSSNNNNNNNTTTTTNNNNLQQQQQPTTTTTTTTTTNNNNNKQQTTNNNQQPTTNNQQPTTNNQQQPTTTNNNNNQQ